MIDATVLEVGSQQHVVEEIVWAIRAGMMEHITDQLKDGRLWVQW